ncbi:MAG: type IV pilus modification protein PilV [Pseudomonas sp.]|uniref:type IV pilus modification protein PilV n=1 Tax=Pseudomonas sp. TaxID=306 RepID=UPI002735A39C|nr:type IV pilus modification protein PilV [Pseudomonas sp.]MDP3846284.1 type IV pilus modification protein PilV [Pseudomonas sp.]
MKTQTGFSLIEVLVTLILVTTGVLGMLAMQSRSIHYTQESIQRNAAVDLTNQLIEIMRANPQLIFDTLPPIQPVSSDLKTTSIFYKAKGKDFAPAPKIPVAGACIAPGTARLQRDCWVEQVKRRLPNATALFNANVYICRSSTPTATSNPICDATGSALEIQLAWRVKSGECPDDRAPNETTCIYRTRVEL